MSKYHHIIIAFFALVLLSSCHHTNWSTINTSGHLVNQPIAISKIFKQQPNGILTINLKSPGYDYIYDIGEKDRDYGNSNSNFVFTKVEIKLHERTPYGKVLTDLTFSDTKNNKVLIKRLDLLRLTPKFDAKGDMIYPEIIEEEFNRFGYTFRKEHKEFEIILANDDSADMNAIKDRAYRCQIVNNCLAATKWEFVLVTEDYSDFYTRLDDYHNLNQNKTLSHSWFYLNKPLYDALIRVKNPSFRANIHMDYNQLSDKAENVTIDFNTLRNPIKYRLETTTTELGHKSKRRIEPLDNEQYYKKEFDLILEAQDQTYYSILQSPVKTTQFREEGFYFKSSPKEFDLNWMNHLDQVHLDVIDIDGTDAYIELTLTGEWSPYKINIGNIDLSQLNEQKLYGMLFGFNTYPKSRRYNPKQSTLVYDPDLLPEDIKPYVLLTNTKNDKWVNNQYKGIEKIYLTYESLERDVIEIYVLSYERITPVWMAKVKLPKEIREKIRIRQNLYNY